MPFIYQIKSTEYSSYNTIGRIEVPEHYNFGDKLLHYFDLVKPIIFCFHMQS